MVGKPFQLNHLLANTMIALLRAKKEYIQTLAAEGRVGYGWSDADLTGAESGEECMQRVTDLEYVNLSSRQYGAYRGQLNILCKLDKGDYLVIPTWGGIHIAIMTAPRLLHDRRFYNDPTNSNKVIDQANTLQVEFLENEDGSLRYFHRDTFTEGLQSRLKFKGTVNNLDPFKEEILDVIEGKGIQEKHAESLLVQEKSFKGELLKRLHSGRTFLKSGGRGLELLVKELVELQGYTASIFDKRKFKGIGDADVLAEKSDPILGDLKLLIQVKHHRNLSGEHMLKQLEAIQINESETWGDYKMVAITTGSIKESYRDKYLSDESSIISILDGESLVDLIYENLSKLSPKTQKSLGVSFHPQFY
jgi:restriction system protein